jgi:hypothetical protein
VATVDERSRHELYLSIEELIGAEKAETLMSMLPSVGWADVATKQDLVAMRADIAALEERLGRDITALEERLVLQFRSELHLALRDQLRTLVFALIGALFTMMSLNLTAIALLR